MLNCRFKTTDYGTKAYQDSQRGVNVLIYAQGKTIEHRCIRILSLTHIMHIHTHIHTHMDKSRTMSHQMAISDSILFLTLLCGDGVFPLFVYVCVCKDYG